MTETTGDLQRLVHLAASLRPRFTPEKPLPRLLFLTDPVRTPDPEAVARGLPEGFGVIYRAFGAAEALDQARRLRDITAARGVMLLIGADADLATTVGADGVHLPERLIDEAKALRTANSGWTITAAAHGRDAVQRAFEGGCDAVLASTVFPSRSVSAGEAMGAARFQAFVQAAPLPVYALGGVNMETAPELIGSGAAGLAMIEAVVDAVRT